MGIGGLIMAPYNWDSMTYHMARIAYWVQNGSVAPYPVNNDRQIIFLPFAEYVITQLYLLAGGDRLANMVQFVSYVLSGGLVYLIARYFSVNRTLSLIGAALFWLLPMAIMQSITTQNDLVVTFMVLSSLYYGLKLCRAFSYKDIFAFSCAVSCGMLTKGTYYFFVSPFFLWFGLVYLRRYKIKAFYLGSIALAFVLIINGPMWYRNVVLYGNPVTAGDSFAKEWPSFLTLRNVQKSPSATKMLSVLSKNFYLHTVPPHTLAIFDWQETLVKWHQKIGVDLNDKDINPWGNIYSGFLIHEDISGNGLYLYILLMTVIAYIFAFRRKNIALYLTCFVSSYFLYCFFTTYQPWETRLDLPVFATSVPFVVYVWQNARRHLSFVFLKEQTDGTIKETSQVSFALIILLFLTIAAFPFYKEIVGKISYVTTSRTSQYFYRRPNLYDPYRQVGMIMYNKGLNHLGLALNADAWEYPLFRVTRKIKGREIRSIQNAPYYDKLVLEGKPFEYQAIIGDDDLFADMISDLIDEKIDLGEGFYLIILKKPQITFYHAKRE